MRRRPRPPALLAALWVLLAATASAQAPTAVPAGRILPAPPATPDLHASYVFYLHGRIVEEQGDAARHPRFGRYEYAAILGALAQPRHVVISERRPPSTTVPRYAKRLVAQLRALLAAGVSASRITVIGASKGGAIALAASRALAVAEVGYVVLGSCPAGAQAGGLHGDVLSIYETSDELGRSCARAFAASPRLGKRRELALQTGLQHGFLYSPLAAWLDPALAWVDALRS
jgi:hypothetical protein